MSFITLSYVTLATSAKSPDGAIRRRCVMRNCHVVVSKNGNKPLLQHSLQTPLTH